MITVSKAAKYGNLELLKLLVEQGKSINLTNDAGFTPLHHATYNNRVDCVKYLLTLEDVRVDAKTYDGKTPLYLACECNSVSVDIVKALIDANADVNIPQDTRETPLHAVCLSSHVDGSSEKDAIKKVELLIAADVDLNAVDYLHDETPLFSALCPQINCQLVDILLHAGCDANIHRSPDGCTPLMLATQMDNYELVKTLLPFVSDLDATNVHGRTALILARSTEIIELLITHGADPNIISSDGQKITALHIAAKNRNCEAIDLLLKIIDKDILDSCDEYNLLGLITTNVDIYTPESLDINLFKCMRIILEADLNVDTFHIVVGDLGSEPIVSLFIPGTLHLTKELWEEYLTILFLLLSKGIQLSYSDDLELIFAECYQYTKYTPRIRILLDILVDHGLTMKILDKAQEQMFYHLQCPYATHIPILFLHMSTYLLYREPYEFIEHYKRILTRANDCYSDFHRLINNKGYIDILRTDSLQSICRTALRKYMISQGFNTTQYFRAVNELPIPEKLKDFIRYQFR